MPLYTVTYYETVTYLVEAQVEADNEEEALEKASVGDTCDGTEHRLNQGEVSDRAFPEIVTGD